MSDESEIASSINVLKKQVERPSEVILKRQIKLELLDWVLLQFKQKTDDAFEQILLDKIKETREGN